MQDQNGGKKVFAVVGMCGSGKSEVIKYLQENFGFPKVYFGEVTFERMKEEEVEMNQDNERKTREKIRAEYGMGAYAKLSLPKIQDAFKQSDMVLIESLYSWEEYKIIKKEYPDFFKVIAVYAGPAVRFSRLKERLERPLKTYEEFEKRDWTEIENIEKGGPIAIADYTIHNESSLENLHVEIEKIVSKEGLKSE